MDNIINNKIKELKQRQINYTTNDNKKLEEECKKILPIILALLSSQYIKYSSSNFKLQRMVIMKEIERNLVKIKKQAEESQSKIIIASLMNNFNNTYSSNFNLLKLYKDISVNKRDFTEEQINKIIQSKFYDKNLDKRVIDNTALVLNKIYKIINDYLSNSKPLDKTIIDVNKTFDTLNGLGKRLLDTESTRIFTTAQDEVFSDFGITEVMWCAELCQNTCSYCAGQSGEIYPINDKPLIPAHANCNCYWEIV